MTDKIISMEDYLTQKDGQTLKEYIISKYSSAIYNLESIMVAFSSNVVTETMLDALDDNTKALCNHLEKCAKEMRKVLGE